MNPRTVSWQMITAKEDGSFAMQRPFDKIEILNEPTFLQEPIRQKELLLLKEELREKMNTLKVAFYHDWQTLEAARKKVTSSQKEAVAHVIVQSDSPEDALKKLDTWSQRKTAEKPFLEYITAMRDVLKAKIAYQKEIDKLCAMQNPPVDQLLQELFVTHFEATSEMTDMLDAEMASFMTRLTREQA